MNMEPVEHLLHITHDCYLPGTRPLLGYLEVLVQSANVHLMMYTETLLIKSNRMVVNITYSLITYLYLWDFSRISSCYHVPFESHVILVILRHLSLNSDSTLLFGRIGLCSFKGSCIS